MSKELTDQDYENGLAETGIAWAGVFNHRRTWKKTPDHILREARDKARRVFRPETKGRGTSHATCWAVCSDVITGVRAEYNGRLFRYSMAAFQVDPSLLSGETAYSVAVAAFRFWGREGFEMQKAASDNELVLAGFAFAIIPDDACDMTDVDWSK